jgi:transposase
MAEPLVPDELGEAIAPLLPRHKARPGRRGRPPVEDRAGRTGMVFVLRRGIPWEMLPQERGCGSGVTCGRRLRSWQRRGVCKKLRHALRQRVGQERGSDGQHGGVDSPSFRAVLGGPHRQNPTDRAKKGTQRHGLVDGKGTPLALRLTGANRTESLEAMNWVDDSPPLRGRRGRPRRQPKALDGDRP